MSTESNKNLSFESAQIVALQNLLAAETTERIKSEMSAQRLEAQIAALRRSFSWRITSPLRKYRRSKSR